MDRQWAESWAVQKWPLHPHQTCKNIAETDAEVAEAAGDLEAKETNLTVRVVLASLEEELPAPAPLVGTFPHDFAMPLPSVSRRSYEPGPGTHSYEEQGQCGIQTFFR